MVVSSEAQSDNNVITSFFRTSQASYRGTGWANNTPTCKGWANSELSDVSQE